MGLHFNPNLILFPPPILISLGPKFFGNLPIQFIDTDLIGPRLKFFEGRLKIV